MREPELEEEQLLLEAEDNQLVIERRSLEVAGQTAGGLVELTAPDGTSQEVELSAVGDGADGRAVARLDGVAEGFWRATQSLVRPEAQGQEELLEAFALVGRNLQREFATPFSTPELLRPLVNQTGGSVLRLEEHPAPRVRRIRNQASAGGRSDWLAVLDRRATRTLNTEVIPLLPAPLVAALLLALLLFAWRRESH